MPYIANVEESSNRSDGLWFIYIFWNRIFLKISGTSLDIDDTSYK